MTDGCALVTMTIGLDPSISNLPRLRRNQGEQNREQINMSNKDPAKTIDSVLASIVTRRDFIKVSAGTIAWVSFSPMLFGCNSGAAVEKYPIDSTVVKTTMRMISFSYTAPSGLSSRPDPPNSPSGGEALRWEQLREIQRYDLNP